MKLESFWGWGGLRGGEKKKASRDQRSGKINKHLTAAIFQSATAAAAARAGLQKAKQAARRSTARLSPSILPFCALVAHGEPFSCLDLQHEVLQRHPGQLQLLLLHPDTPTTSQAEEAINYELLF